MSKVQIRLPSWVVAIVDAKASDSLTLEVEIQKDTTTSDLLTNLVATYPGFRQAVFNPDAGHVNEQLAVVMNDKVMTLHEVTQTKLNDGDTIMLIPLYLGG